MQDACDKTVAQAAAPNRSPGLVLHRAAQYDLLVWLLTRGRERVLRERILDLAQIAPGDSVLEVGCGTGTLAIAARRRVGPGGRVVGIDASPAMIGRAEKKARKAGVEVAFETALAQALPFAAQQFDAALSTVMLHHLSREARRACAREMARVVRPGGRVLAVDFAGAAPGRHRFLRRLHRHGHVDAADLAGLLSAAGLDIIERGAVGLHGLQFVLGRAR
ncbi:MAG TPA: methyltransferase domain-containing protein [Stellaceae bacterium]|nr:methyltransferase domain-containing protein [Stellaceae bacterium]